MSNSIDRVTEAVIEPMDRATEGVSAVNETLELMVTDSIRNISGRVNEIVDEIQKAITDAADAVSGKESGISIDLDDIRFSLGGQEITATGRVRVKLVALKDAE